MSPQNKLVWVCVALAMLGSPIGCSTKREAVEQKQQESDRSPITTPSDSGARVAPEAPEHAVVVDSARSVAELFSQIHEHESHLSQIIAAGRLNELDADASKISALLAESVHLAQVPSDQRDEFERHVSEAKRAATAIGAAGKAGNLEESKARNADLQKELGMVERFVSRSGA